MRLRKSAHGVYKTQYHVVIVTKYRRKILVRGVKQYLRVIFQEIRKFRPGVERRTHQGGLGRNFHFLKRHIGGRGVYGRKDFSYLR